MGSRAVSTPEGGQQSEGKPREAVPSVKMGPYELLFEPDDLDEEFREKARKDLRETSEIAAEAYRELKKLLEGEPDLHVPTDEAFLVKFLRPCKWYPKSAFELMKRFYKFRMSHAKLTTNLVPSLERVVFTMGVLTPLPIRTKEGERVLMLEGGKKWKPKELPLHNYFRGAMLALDAAMGEPKTQVAGARVIFDMDGLSLGQVTYFTPSFAASVVEWVQSCLPARLRGIHIVNQPYIFNMVFAIFKPFLHEKLRKRIHFHGTDRASLMSHIDADALPKRLGGNLDIPNVPIGESLWQYFCNFEEDFREANTYGYVKKNG